ncbi:MAG: cyclic nucleotide-binding domain-containing protein, partial [Gammaproteobacteria bacterium]|nr:cyclic nucleotide-binding domain-containing protein [Gammaproteobacteria bacterium]
MDHFLEQCKRQHFPARATVMRPGDSGQSLMYLIEGSVTVSTEGDDGRELILSYLNPGDFIGEMGLFMRPTQREVLVRTRSKCELAEISYARLREALEHELKDHALEIMTAIGAKLAQRLLHTRRKVEHLAFLDTQGRVARTLIDLCGEPDAVSHPEGTQIRITRQEVSRIVGCSREMAGRVMKTLEE